MVKVGSSLLVDREGGRLHDDWLASLAEDIADLHRRQRDLLVVSSGAIAFGRAVLKLPAGPLKLEDSQAAAAVGQIALARTWAEVLAGHGITAGQILVTLQDTEERRRYLNARSTIDKLLEWRAVPVINENDTVATNEIRYGDNDRLAARVATMASADLLVLLSDVDGLYDAPPAGNPRATLYRWSNASRPRSRRWRAPPAPNSRAAECRPRSKPARSQPRRNPHGDRLGPHRASAQAIAAGARCTWFLTPANPVTARKKWIAGSLEPKGTLTIDAGAVAALRSGKSLLPAGVIRVDGMFARGDAVVIRGPDGAEVGRGLVAYDAEDAAKIRGRSSADIALDPRVRRAHRDGAPGRPGGRSRVSQARPTHGSAPMHLRQPRRARTARSDARFMGSDIAGSAQRPSKRRPRRPKGPGSVRRMGEGLGAGGHATRRWIAQRPSAALGSCPAKLFSSRGLPARAPAARPRRDRPIDRQVDCRPSGNSR